MHDPLVVAFEIRRPWPQRTARGWYWPTLITIWHREPGGHDAGTICPHYDKPTARRLNGWRFHIHHWRLQIRPLQKLRRRLLTRCAWCNGRHRPGDPVDVGHSWAGRRGRWWRGELGLYHQDCSAVAGSRAGCNCEAPICGDTGPHGPYGRCLVCGKTRAFGLTPQQATFRRSLQQIPRFTRDCDTYHRALRAMQAEQPAEEIN